MGLREKLEDAFKQFIKRAVAEDYTLTSTTAALARDLEAVTKDVSNLNEAVSVDQRNTRFSIERRLDAAEYLIATRHILDEDFKAQMGLELGAIKKALAELVKAPPAPEKPRRKLKALHPGYESQDSKPNHHIEK